MRISEYDYVFAVPGERSIIDVVNPDTGLSCVNGRSLSQIREQYPNALMMPWTEWEAIVAALQNTPITFTATTSAQYHDMLNVLPPAAWTKGCFLVGEPTDHSVTTGRPRFQMYRQRGEQFDTSSRPVTVAEFRAIVEQF